MTKLAGLLLAGAATFCLLTLRPGAGSSGARGGVHIGFHPNVDEGIRAAARRIAADMKLHPEATRFLVSWSDSRLAYLRLDEEPNRKSLLYDSRREFLSQGDFGGEGGFRGVNRELFLAAAASGNPWRFLRGKGCPEYP